MYVGLQYHAFQSVWQPGHELMGVMLHEAVVGGVSLLYHILEPIGGKVWDYYLLACCMVW